MKTIIGTGLSGMVGSSILALLGDAYTFENMSLETGVDITDVLQVQKIISQSKAEWVIHLAAMTNVDQAEKEAHLKEESLTWKVNVGATGHLVDACRTYNKRLLYISTDFVFAGGAQIYTEDDEPQPIGWYATTKYEGEKRIHELGDRGLIVRLSFPYGSEDGPKKDFVGRIRELFEQQTTVLSPTDQIITPTYLPDIVSAIELLITSQATGVYHVVGSQSVSSYEASCIIADAFGYNRSLIKEISSEEFYKGRAPRATKLRISNKKLVSLGLTPLTFAQGITRLKAKEK